VGDPGPFDGFLDVADGSADPGAGSAYVGSRVVLDVDLPSAAPGDLPVRLVLTGGAGQLAGPAGLAARRGLGPAAVEVALRDDTDPAGNARRVVAAVDDARATGRLAADALVHVAVSGPPAGRWLDAADEVAAAELALTLPLDRGGDDVPGWIDAALDRETAFSLHGADVRAAVDALRTTARLWEPGAAPTDPAALLAARRWCRSWRCPDLAAAVADLRELG